MDRKPQADELKKGLISRLNDRAAATPDGEAAALMRQAAISIGKMMKTIESAIFERPQSDAADLVKRLRSTAVLLYNNAVGCAQEHYGEDFATKGMPGWLADCKADIDRATALIEAHASPCEDRVEAVATCEACEAPLFEDDDFVSDQDCVSGCWSAITDLPGKQERPCYTHRVGKPRANEAITVEQRHTDFARNHFRRYGEHEPDLERDLAEDVAAFEQRALAATDRDSVLEEAAGWQPIETAPKDGTRFVALDSDDAGELPYICYWEKDLYSPNGGKGGPSGWFAGNYADHWHDKPQEEWPVFWLSIPSIRARKVKP